MKKIRFVILIAVFLLPVAGICQQPSDKINVRIHPQANPWTGLDLNNDPETFQFAIMSDRTGGMRPGVFDDAVRKVNMLQPEFVMCVGDLIEGYTEEDAKLDQMWSEFNALVKSLEMPFFYVSGNHDISNIKMLGEWKERFGRSYYHFTYRNVLFLVLNTQDPPDGSDVSDTQIEYVKKVLSENNDVRWTLIFFHQPLWVEEARVGWPKVEALWKDRPCTVFAGHKHTYTKFNRDGHDYYMLSTTGGSSDLSGVEAGKFDHITWVTMREDGPRVVNLLLDGILPDDVVVKE
ncbi:MAG: metallophosphoesterase [bacterium]